MEIPSSLSLETEEDLKIKVVKTETDPKDDGAGDLLPPPTFVFGSCETCGQKFKLRQSLLKHKSKCNGRPRPYNGKNPPIRFRINKTTNLYLYQCDQVPCTKLYSSESRLRRHKVMIHGIGEGSSPIQCPHCPKSIPNQPDLDHHIRFVHKLKESDLACPGCSTKFLENYGLFQHVRLNKLDNTTCPHCTESFTWKCGLNQHLKSKCNNSSLRVHCLSCSNNFPNYKKFWDHKRYCHEIIPVPCPHCGQQYKNLVHLAKHIRMSHNKTKVTTSTSSLGTPPTRQGEPRPGPRTSYTCPHCAHDFKTYRTNLERHLNLMLPKQKGDQFSCSRCLEKFDAKCVLKIHQRVQKCQAGDGRCAYACDTLLKKHSEECTVPRTDPNDYGKMIKLEDIENVVLEDEEIPPNPEEKFEDEDPLLNSDEKIDEEFPKEGLPLTCPHCQQKFIRDISLQRHFNMNRKGSGSTGAELNCPTCDQNFNFKCEKAQHICNTEDSVPVTNNKSPVVVYPPPSDSDINQVQDELGGPFYCWTCNIAFRVKLQFFQHIRQIHNEEPEMS